MTLPIALTIAGSDSGGGAGIQADLKTFHAFGVYGTSAITAITAQNTLGVSAVHAVPAEMVREQIDAVVSDLRPHASKTGMLATAELVGVVARAIRDHGLENYVLDPVMVASSGDRLLDENAIGAVRDALMPMCTVITPNLDRHHCWLERPCWMMRPWKRPRASWLRAVRKLRWSKAGICRLITCSTCFTMASRFAAGNELASTRAVRMVLAARFPPRLSAVWPGINRWYQRSRTRWRSYIAPLKRHRASDAATVHSTTSALPNPPARNVHERAPNIHFGSLQFLARHV